MRDGTTLISDHYYPAAPGPHPTLLMRQPYGRDIASTVVYVHPIWFARQGYNVVIQDVRGRGDSGGLFYPFRQEAHDGFDTIDALRQRPESNGKFGMYGFSYQGITQWLAAAEQPEGLLCIAPAQAAHDLYHGWFYQNGALKLASTLGWGLQMLKEDARRLELHEASARLERAWQNLPAQLLETPYARHPALRSEGLPTYVADWLDHTEPGDYWSALDISQKMPQIKIPALHLSGWFDTYLSGSINGFLAATQHAAPEARAHQYLAAGPWQHIPWGQRIGTTDLGPEANLDTDALHLRFFNHYLKDTNEFAHEPRIRYFTLNENKWHTASTWPSLPSRQEKSNQETSARKNPAQESSLQENLNEQKSVQEKSDQEQPVQEKPVQEKLDQAKLDQEELDQEELNQETSDQEKPDQEKFVILSEAEGPASVLFLHSQGRANSSKGDGTLTPQAPQHEEPSDTYIYDPEVPVQAPGAQSGPLNQSLLQQGNNLLIYTSAPLDKPLHILGHPLVELHAQTSAPHADLTAKLCLLKPSGESLFLCLGILRSTHEPDTPTLFRFQLDPTSCLFRPGDRIRLEIASSAYPLFDRNPSTAIPPSLASPWNWRRSTQTLHHTPEKPSCLHLPEVKA